MVESSPTPFHPCAIKRSGAKRPARRPMRAWAAWQTHGARRCLRVPEASTGAGKRRSEYRRWHRNAC